MAASVADQVAKAVLEELQGKSWSLSFVPYHREFVEQELENLDNVTVIVLDTEVAIVPATRSKDFHQPVIQIHVQRHCKDDQYTIGQLKTLIEEIAVHFARLSFTTASGYHASILEAVYGRHRDFASLWEKRLYWGIVTLRYQVER